MRKEERKLECAKHRKKERKKYRKKESINKVSTERRKKVERR